MVFDPIVLSSLANIAAAFAAAFLAALWLSLVFWTWRDMRRRSRDMLLRILAVLIVLILFLPGFIIYMILRPPVTIEQEYQQTLEEESLLQTIEEPSSCPGCGRKVREDWMVCPSCHTRLKKPCASCGKLNELAWNLCPFCGTPEPGARLETLSSEEILSPLPQNSAQPAEEPETPVVP